MFKSGYKLEQVGVGDMTFVPNNESPDTLKLCIAELLMKLYTKQRIKRNHKEGADKYAGNMWSYTHKLYYNARHGRWGFIQSATSQQALLCKSEASLTTLSCGE